VFCLDGAFGVFDDTPWLGGVPGTNFQRQVGPPDQPDAFSGCGNDALANDAVVRDRVGNMVMFSGAIFFAGRSKLPRKS